LWEPTMAAGWAAAMQGVDAELIGSKSGVAVGKTAGAIAALASVTLHDKQALGKLCRSGVTLSEKDAEGNGVVHFAVESGDVNLVEVLCEHFKDEPTYLDEPNNQGQSPIFVAARVGDVQILKRLLNSRADPTRRDVWGFTALHVSSMFGHLDISKQLMSRGCDAFTFDNIHQSPANIVEKGFDRACGEIKNLQMLARKMQAVSRKALMADPRFQRRFIRMNAPVLRRYFVGRAVELGAALHHSWADEGWEDTDSDASDSDDDDSDDDSDASGDSAGSRGSKPATPGSKPGTPSASRPGTPEAKAAGGDGDGTAAEGKEGDGKKNKQEKKKKKKEKKKKAEDSDDEDEKDGKGSDSESEEDEKEEEKVVRAVSAPPTPGTPGTPRHRDPVAKEFFEYCARLPEFKRDAKYDGTEFLKVKSVRLLREWQVSRACADLQCSCFALEPNE